MSALPWTGVRGVVAEGAVRAHRQRRHGDTRSGGEGPCARAVLLTGCGVRASPVSATVRLVSRGARPPAGRAPATLCNSVRVRVRVLVRLLVSLLLAPATSRTVTVLPYQRGSAEICSCDMEYVIYLISVQKWEPYLCKSSLYKDAFCAMTDYCVTH